jgi:hypothetical protein
MLLDSTAPQTEGNADNTILSHFVRSCNSVALRWVVTCVRLLSAAECLRQCYLPDKLSTSDGLKM